MSTNAPDAIHQLTMDVQDEPRMFRARCACGWLSVWRPTNACMGNGRRHLAAMRRKAAS